MEGLKRIIKEDGFGLREEIKKENNVGNEKKSFSDT